MGLDKWLKQEKNDKKSRGKKESPEEAKKTKDDQAKIKNGKIQSIKLNKYTLICKNNKCKYQKVIMKRELTQKDKKCPRCEKEMKIKEG